MAIDRWVRFPSFHVSGRAERGGSRYGCMRMVVRMSFEQFRCLPVFVRHCLNLFSPATIYIDVF